MSTRKRKTSETPMVVPDDVALPSVWESPSFWVSVIPAIAALVSIVFGKTYDVTPAVQGLALLAAGIASAGLAVARSMRHQAVLAANTTRASLRVAMLTSPDTPNPVKKSLIEMHEKATPRE